VKIAIVHFTAPPVIGGVERVIQEQISLLKNAGHCVTLACFEGGRDCKADCLVPLSREADRSALFTYLNAALSDSDVVLMHNVGTMPFAVELTAALRELAARISHARWICWVHDLACTNPAYLPFSTPEIQGMMTTRCEHWEYVAVSEFRSNEVRARLGVDCVHIPNGISPAEILQLQPKVQLFAEMHGIWDADLVLLHPARMVARKGIQTGVQVMKELRDLGIAAKYLLTAAKDPHHKPSLEYEREIRALANSLDVAGQFIFVSDFLHVGPIELQNLYLLADAVFFPSLQEGFGLPILEAAMFGTPAVCADIDPLNTLPGPLLYDPLLNPKQLAGWIIRHVLSRDSIKARRLVAADYRWEQIYRKHLAPLLQPSK
jgi:glycosyltransferase involved in cell wall biosynthesis